MMMTEKGSRPASSQISKPLPMKLFATWEVDRTPPNCIPRLCSLTLTRLLVLRPLGADLSAITIAVKMQSSKRILRSNEMALPTTGLLDTELELHFALQYPHFIKRDHNTLHILLQRRKRYKNRTILGFKTLAEGVINMSLVLQRQMDLDLDLLSTSKEGKAGGVVARVTVSCLMSQPVDQKMLTDPSDRFSDEEEDFGSSQEDDAEGSDSEPMLNESGHRIRKQRSKMPPNARQRNLKQKFIALLKRLRQNEGGPGADQEGIDRTVSGGDMDPAEIEDLFEELDDLSESGPEMDTLSISSTPKPSLRPFFSSSKSLLQDTLPKPGVLEESCETEIVEKDAERGLDRLSDESSKGRADSDSGHPDGVLTDADISDPPPPMSPPRDENRKSRLFLRDKPLAKPKKSVSEPRGLVAVVETVEPRKGLTEQLSKLLGPEDSLIDHLVLVAAGDVQGSLLAQRLQDRQLKVLPIINHTELRPVLNALVNKLQKVCHSSAKQPNTVKVMAVGSDLFLNAILRQYVEQLSIKPPDLQTHLKFLFVPLGISNIARYLGSIDNTYNASFSDEMWRDLAEARGDATEMVARIALYLHNCGAVVFLPIAEAMLTYKDKSSDEESTQLFIPFISDVRVGATECPGASVDLDDACGGGQGTGNSPPRITPPSSPHVMITGGQTSLGGTIGGVGIGGTALPGAMSPASKELIEPLELQLDYWTSAKQIEPKEKKDSNKSSLKTTFKALTIQRLPSSGEQPTHYFLINYATKEKKQKIMRLGKKKEKERETENRSQQVDSVCRMICSSRTHSLPLKVYIDGVEWSGVKFFQLSAQWQTHIKTFPVAIFSQDAH